MNMKTHFYIIPFLIASTTVSASHYEIDAREIPGGQSYTVSIVRHHQKGTEKIEVPINPGIINKGELGEPSVVPGKSLIFVQKTGNSTIETLLPHAYYPKLGADGNLRIKMTVEPDERGNVSAIFKDLK